MRLSNEGRLVWLLGRSVVGNSDLGTAFELLNSQELDLDVVARLTRQNKVVPTLLNHLEKLEGDRVDELRRQMVENYPHFARIALYREEMQHNLQMVLQTLAETGVETMLIKGCALFYTLPDYTLRFMRDIDLMFRDVRSMWVAAQALVRSGLVVDELEGPWVQNFSPAPGTPKLEAHLTLCTVDRRCKVELHSDNMVVCDRGMVRSRLWENPGTVEIGGQAARVPSPEDTLVTLLAHSTTHGYFTLKDFNDAHALLQRYRATYNWAYTLETLRDNGLLPYFAYLLNVLENEYGLSLPLPEHSSAHAVCSPTLKKWLDRSLVVADATWWDQTRAMALFTLNYVSGRESWLSAPGAYASALWRGARQAKYDDWPLWVQSLVDRAERGPFFARTPPQGLQVMLAPVTVELCSAWAGIEFDTNRTVRILREKGFDATTVEAIDSICVRVGQDEILATPAGLFLPTRYAVFTEDQLKSLSDAAERVWKAVAEESPQSTCAVTRERY